MDTSKIAATLGRGLLSGLAGTVVITAAMLVETQLTGPDQSAEMEEVPAQAVEKTTGAHFKDEQHASQWVHWGYGTGWGAFRSFLSFCGVRGLNATLLHFAALTGAASVMLPLLKLSPPPHKTPFPKILSQSFNHLLYAIVAGAVFDTLTEHGGNKPINSSRHAKEGDEVLRCAAICAMNFIFLAIDGANPQIECADGFCRHFGDS